ncbi:MAG: MoxR family ATPase [Candidatus Abyssobacteria bacterium SURF_17]|uniref:MoxR family ATPase n=1 Tax=Candidatus Abyssobacteria bacterium SURF_17 TaxID=2093361 RepID=A0A419EZE2_9BACT|nr:MAG: MoxR family ATPase [Candidatus Abyssubacteria bacterium SURF_17]
MSDDVEKIRNQHRIVGRAEELAAALACVRLNRNLLIEGPVGVGKTVLALAIAQHLERPFFRVDGDERYTEQKLTGWFDPPIVLAKGYTQSAFIPGPLTQAMLDSGILFINELNRMPESVQNVLLPSLDEHIISIPKYGEVIARDGFTVIATQNPRDFVATTHLSEALRDRFELITLDYQTFDEEVEIVRLNLSVFVNADEKLIRDAVAVTRATREAPQIRRGASVRAAISIVELASSMSGSDALRRAAHISLPTRIELADDAHLPARKVIDTVVDGIVGNSKKKD